MTASKILFLSTILLELNNIFQIIYEKILYLKENGILIQETQKVLQIPDKNSCIKRINKDFKSININNITFSYDGIDNVIDGISFELLKGKHIALVGENGSGKTTLAKIICGLYSPDRGEFIIDNETHVDNMQPMQDNISVLFQDSSVLAASIAENVACVPNEEIEKSMMKKSLKRQQN